MLFFLFFFLWYIMEIMYLCTQINNYYGKIIMKRRRFILGLVISLILSWCSCTNNRKLSKDVVESDFLILSGSCIFLNHEEYLNMDEEVEGHTHGVKELFVIQLLYSLRPGSETRHHIHLMNQHST